MNFEFLIAYWQKEGVNVPETLIDLLSKALQDNLNDVETDAVKQMIRFQHSRACDEALNHGETSRHTLLGFGFDLPDETEQLQIVLDDFTSALAETSPIFHVVKFEDPLLRTDLARWAKEMFDLEMKLRRVLSLIYLHANPISDPYDLLRDETVQPIAKEKPNPSQMRARQKTNFFT